MFLTASGVAPADPLGAAKALLTTLDQRVDDSVRIDRIRALEELKGAVAAAQARETAAFVASQRRAQAERGVPAERVGRGVAAQVGLARRVSPYEAARYVGQAVILTSELPETFTQLAAGAVPEWRALLVARETAWLSAEHRAELDRLIAPQLEGLGNRKTVDQVKKYAYQLDPRGYVDRLAKLEAERHVSLRPAPECMARLTALLPVAQGVAAFAALRAAADAGVGSGDKPRTRGQLMADTLVERVTGLSHAADVPVEVNVIMTDQSLFGTGPDEPATVIGAGAIPAELARRMVVDRSGESTVLLRRLYSAPRTGELVAMESRSRRFTENQRKFLVLRDQTCRTPWCDAPIRHADHVVSAEAGGPTHLDNGQGLCEACNYAKQAEGWSQTRDGDDVAITTPTGHQYRSRAPSPPARPARTLDSAA